MTSDDDETRPDGGAGGRGPGGRGRESGGRAGGRPRRQEGRAARGRAGAGGRGERAGRGQGGSRGRGATAPDRGATPRGTGPAAPLPRRRPPKPALDGDVPRLRRDVYRDLKAAAPPKELDDVVRAVVRARDLVEEGAAADALRLLEWAKAVAPRSVVVRETMGIAAYHAGDFATAHRELLAYRRLSNRQDQNHLLADCARALGRPEKVDEYVADMARADVPAERLAEAYLVQAGLRADRGDFAGALAALEQAGLDASDVRPHHLRLWYAAADLWERQGDHERAREYFAAIVTLDEDFLDAGERLRELEGEG